MIDSTEHRDLVCPTPPSPPHGAPVRDRAGLAWAGPRAGTERIIVLRGLVDRSGGMSALWGYQSRREYLRGAKMDKT